MTRICFLFMAATILMSGCGKKKSGDAEPDACTSANEGVGKDGFVKGAATLASECPSDVTSGDQPAGDESSGSGAAQPICKVGEKIQDSLCVPLTFAEAGSSVSCRAINGFWYDAADVTKTTEEQFDSLSPTCHELATDSCPTSGLVKVAASSYYAQAASNLNATSVNLESYLATKIYSTIRCLTAMTDLNVGSNLTLTSLDIANNPGLRKLWAYATGIASLDMKRNTQLERIDCTSCPLSTIDVAPLKDLKYLHLSGTNLSRLDLGGLSNLEMLSAGISGLTTLDLRDQISKLWFLDVSKAYNLTTLNLSQHTLIYHAILGYSGVDLTKVGLAGRNLYTLDLSGFGMSSLPFPLASSLRVLKLDANNLSSINTGALPLLLNFSAESCGLSAVDLSSNTALTDLNLRGNALAAINLSTNLGLKTLNLENNNLNYDGVSTFLNLASHSALKEIRLRGNQNYALKFTGAASNPLFHAGFTGNTSINRSNFYVEEAKWDGNGDSNKPVGWVKSNAGVAAKYTSPTP